MMTDKRNTRHPRSKSVDTDRFSEQARKSRRESQSSRYDSFDTSNYGTQDRDGSYAGAYSRRVSQGEYTRKRQQQKRKKTILVVAAVALVLILGGAGAAFAYLNIVSGNLHEGLDGSLQDVLVETDLTNEPFYMLLMGVDGSEEREGSEEYAGDSFRSDSIMLARIDPVDKKVTIVSIPRDTLVDMGEEYGENKINAAHALGGPTLSVQVVSELAGVPISHYAEINFDGFKGIVDSLGGIEVDVPMEIDDPQAGGYLAPGLQTLNGDQALILCRSRHAYDDFGGGDYYRAANQRLVLSAIAKKLLASDVATIAGSVTAISEYVTTDLELTDIVGLAQAMRGLDPSTSIYSAMAPTEALYVAGGWYDYIDTAAWKEMMARVDQGLPPTEEDVIDEASGTVMATTGSGEISAGQNSAGAKKSGNITVKNGSGVTGVAAEAGSILEAMGYTVETGNADAEDYQSTLVIYASADLANEAMEIASALDSNKTQLNDGSYNMTGDFLVVIGADW